MQQLYEAAGALRLELKGLINDKEYQPPLCPHCGAEHYAKGVIVDLGPPFHDNTNPLQALDPLSWRVLIKTYTDHDRPWSYCVSLNDVMQQETLEMMFADAFPKYAKEDQPWQPQI